MIALLGGTFDPVHEGHVHLANELLREFGFSKVLFIPNAQNPLKSRESSASNEQRYEMLSLAIKENGDPRLEVSRIEIDRPAPSYMVDTVRLLKQSLNEPLSLIVGNEVFEHFDEWKDPKAILETVPVIVVNRFSDRKVDVNKLCAKLHISTQSDNLPDVKEFVFPVLDFSSTAIRKKLEDAWKNDHLTAPVEGLQRSVCLFIKVNKLYAR